MTNKYLYNPTTEDIETWVDQNGDHPEFHVIKAGEIKDFPEPVYSLLKTKLADKMLWENYPKDRNRDKRMGEIYEIIEVPNGSKQD